MNIRISLTCRRLSGRRIYEEKRGRPLITDYSRKTQLRSVISTLPGRPGAMAGASVTDGLSDAATVLCRGAGHSMSVFAWHANSNAASMVSGSCSDISEQSQCSGIIQRAANIHTIIPSVRAIDKLFFYNYNNPAGLFIVHASFVFLYSPLPHWRIMAKKNGKKIDS